MSLSGEFSALCVESRPSLQPILRSVLEGAGFSNSQIVVDLDLCRSLLQHQTFDVLLVDVHAGWQRQSELTRLLKLGFLRSKPVVILMVASMGQDMATFVARLPVDAIIRKPFTSDQLSALIQGVAGLNGRLAAAAHRSKATLIDAESGRSEQVFI